MKFNKQVPTTKTVNLAGGKAYKESSKLELVSILLTSFVKSQFYKDEKETIKGVQELIKNISDKKFIAKAALYARNEFGMRSISHIVAGELAEHARGSDWTRRFFDKIVRRPDDMLEILSYYFSSYRHYIPNAVKKGFSSALGRFDDYQIAKYRGEGKAFKMIDLVNLIRPKPTDKNREALEGLVKGTLRSTGTWETKLTQAGQLAENEEQKEEMKEAAWRELLLEKKLGYFALLRNLRNILEQAPDMVNEACVQLVNEQYIKKSLVLPFRFMTAIEEIEKMAKVAGHRAVIIALNQALEISVSNVPTFEGRTLIALDVSGSMQGKPAAIGALFAAVLAKSNNSADLLTFDTSARYVAINPLDTVATIQKSIPFAGGGTDFHSIFKEIGAKPYDRIILLSDMQAWVGYDTPKISFSSYKKASGVKTKVYSFDLQGYGTLQFPEQDVFALAGFSEKIFDVMKLLEQDRNALIHTIEAIEI